MTESQSKLRVNKRTFLDAIVCPTRGWLTRNLPTEPTPGDELRMEEGLEVGIRARMQYPDGVLVQETSLIAAADLTKKLMANRKVTTIFEATWIVDEFTAKADILIRSGKGWKLIEVKSGTNPSDEYVNDLAYTLMVASKAGTKVDQASLLLLNSQFRLNHDNASLFAEHDYSDKAAKIASEFETFWESVQSSALAQKQPTPKLIFACRNCPYFREPCFQDEKSNHILDLPRLKEPLFDSLVKQNITRIVDIPAEAELAPTQIRVRKAAKTGRAVIEKRDLANFLNQVQWPAFYLDFETVKSAIPLFPSVAPHEQVVTQYSLHVCHAPGKIADHRFYLAPTTGDYRRELAEKLLEDLENQGSIVHYSAFEKTVLNGLAKLFPDLRDPLEACVNRLFDLEKAFRDHYYHPKFSGRTSIKATLPALVDLSYDHLEIGNGDLAVAKYARMVRGEIIGEEAEATRAALLKYCEQDTYGMVLLHKFLFDKAK